MYHERYLYLSPNFLPKLVYSKLCKILTSKVVMPTKRKNKLSHYDRMHKQTKHSFVMLIIRNSSNRPLNLHFFLHYSSGEGGGPFFIIYSLLLGLVLSQVIFLYKQKSFKSREIGSFFHIKTLFKSRRTKQAAYNRLR